MRTKVLSCLMLGLWMLCGTMSAQETNEGVNFVEGKTFAEAVAMAKANGKKVFLDCYTTWCGPCRMMTNTVFPQKVVGDYMNKEFVNIKIDMEKGEGPELAKRLKVRAYPTFVMFDGDGKEIGRMVGGLPNGDEFVTAVKAAIGEMSVASMTERYEKGERDEKFMTEYLTVLSKAYENEKAQKVAAELLEGKETQLLENEALFAAFVKYNSSPMTPAFQYLLQHKDEFMAKYPKMPIERVINMNWMSYPRTLLKKNDDGTATFDHEAMNTYVKEMEKWQVANRDEIVLLSDINVAEGTKNWKEYVKLCSKYIKKYGENDMYIYNWALRVEQNCDDAKVRKAAAKWMENRIKNLKKAEAKRPPLKEGEIRAMPLSTFSGSYEKLIKELK